MDVSYEWDVELVVTYNEDTNDIEEHYFQACYADCVKQAAEPTGENRTHEIVLICNDSSGRSWAYLEDGKLPEYFEDACQRKTRKVPQRFHKEVAA